MQQELTVEASEASCPPAVIEHVQTVDLCSSENSRLFSWVASQSPLECQLHVLGLVADRLEVTSNRQVVDDFTSSVATYARFLSEELRSAVRAAYLRFSYDPSISLNYFAGLRLARIDIRDRLRGKMDEDWSFTHPRQDAATWHLYLYLASLGEAGAHEALEKKLAETENGNDATNLIRSLAEIRTDGARDILYKYRDDQRHADDPEGPGPTIAQTVALLLQAYYAE